MTAVTKPETSRTQVAKASLPPEIQAKIEANRMRNAVVAQIRGTQWGGGLSAETVRAIAQYAHEHGMDPVTEVDVLGGRVYPNAQYYRRRGAPLLRDGTVRDIRHDQIGRDARLDDAVKECEAYAKVAEDAGRAEEATYWREEAFAARREIMRRKRLRAEANAPETAAAVCRTTIALANGVEVVGTNWCGGGVKKGDPVGDAEPAKTAETRSERRAWIKLISSDVAKDNPTLAALARDHRAIREDGVELAEIIVDEQREIAAGQEAARPHKLVGAGSDDPYASDAEQGELIADAPRARTSIDPEQG